MIVKVLWRLENRVEKVKETFNTVNKIIEDIEEIKNKLTEMKNTITEFKNTLEGINSRIIETEEWISELEDRMVVNKGKGMERIEDSLRDLWVNIKHTNIWIIGISKEEGKKRKALRKIFEEIIVENFPNMGKEIVNQVQEAETLTG